VVCNIVFCVIFELSFIRRCKNNFHWLLVIEKMKEIANWMHFAFKFLLEKMIFWNNIIKYDKSLSFLLVIWDKENDFFFLWFRTEWYLISTFFFSFKTSLLNIILIFNSWNSKLMFFYFNISIFNIVLFFFRTSIHTF